MSILGRHQRAATVAVSMSVVLVVAGCSSSSKQTSPGSTGSSGGGNKSPITIGYISNLTGVASSTFTDGPGGAQAIIDAVNAKGGVNGHPLKLIVKDDGSSAATNLTAAESEVASGATVIIEYSSFAFGAAQYLQKQGIPVVGSAFDGPEWATAPDTNMFTWAAPSESPVNGQLYTWTNIGVLLKGLGVKSFGGLGYGISPSSTDSILEAEKAAEAEGISTCYTNNSVGFGATDFTADVLQIKHSNCGAVAGSFVEASDLALSTAMKQAGLTQTKEIFFTGYDQETTANASDAAGFDGDYALATINFSPPNAAGQALLNTLKQYDKSYPGGIPDFGLLGSTISTQLAVYGLSLAGANPTRSSFISNLRKVSSWDDSGLFVTPISFTGFGTDAMFPQKACEYFEQLNGTTWTPYGGGPVCGTRISMKAPS